MLYESRMAFKSSGGSIRNQKAKKLPKRDIFCFELKTGISNSDAGMLWKKPHAFFFAFIIEKKDEMLCQEIAWRHCRNIVCSEYTKRF